MCRLGCIASGTQEGEDAYAAMVLIAEQVENACAVILLVVREDACAARELWPVMVQQI